MKLSSPILAFTLVSTSIHAGLFMMTDSVNMVLPGSTGSAMSIKLENTTSPSEIQSSRTNNISPIANTGSNQLNKLSKNIIPVHKSLSEQKQATIKKPQELKTSSAREQNSQLKAQVISIVYQKFSNHFNYPKIAQRKNWQGEVILTFHITSEGEIKDIEVNHSSGFDILDQAAVSSLKKIGTLPQLSTEFNTDMDIKLPIIYRLTEG